MLRQIQKFRTKPPIDLYRPTLLNIISIICYCVATIFHIIAYATDNWASLLLDGVRWRMGLWQGCREMEDGTEFCTTDVFEDKAFQTGSDWHLGARVMMTLALILIFLLEFTLIAYACIKNLEKYRSKLVGTTLALSLSTALFHVIALILYNNVISRHPESYIRGSYGFVVLSILMEISIPILIWSDRSRRYRLEKHFPSIGREKTPNTVANNASKQSQNNGDAGYSLSTVRKHSNSVRTSMTSLTEAETFRKFADDGEDLHLDGSQPTNYKPTTFVVFSKDMSESTII